MPRYELKCDKCSQSVVEEMYVKEYLQLQEEGQVDTRKGMALLQCHCGGKRDVVFSPYLFTMDGKTR